jgi:LPXTG-site transpeptidase (sortase) family protein
VKKLFNAKTVSKLLLIIGLAFVAITFVPYLAEEAWYRVMLLRNKKYVITATQSGKEQSIFGKIMSNADLNITPVNRDFSIVIEKIGLNAPVVMGVSVTDQNKYNEALKNGVAHALVSDLPSNEPGNVYLFAHTSFNFWSLGKYATAFNLLHNLSYGDDVNLFYHGKRYTYSVVNKEVMSGWNTYPLTRPVIEPLLTMQTCDPPGTTFNRLVVTAKLKKIL